MASANSDVAERSGFRVTTPARTIIDLASLAPDEDQLARAISDARQNERLMTRTHR
jgi:hypothetical protein